LEKRTERCHEPRQTIHPVTVVAMTLGSLLGASLMLAVIELKFVHKRLKPR
jgi:hypothetical protein